MTAPPKPANNAARWLWERVAGNVSKPDQLAAAADRMCAELRTGLGRWIGNEGYQALVSRALAQTRVEHPVLGSFSCLGGDEPGTAAAVGAHGADQVAAGLVAFVAAVIELLGRIIGDDMAVRLVEQVAAPSPPRASPRGVVSSEP